jgi:hypothetical protein
MRQPILRCCAKLLTLPVPSIPHGMSVAKNDTFDQQTHLFLTTIPNLHNYLEYHSMSKVVA